MYCKYKKTHRKRKISCCVNFIKHELDISIDQEVSFLFLFHHKALKKKILKNLRTCDRGRDKDVASRTADCESKYGIPVRILPRLRLFRAVPQVDPQCVSPPPH